MLLLSPCVVVVFKSFSHLILSGLLRSICGENTNLPSQTISGRSCPLLLCAIRIFGWKVSRFVYERLLSRRLVFSLLAADFRRRLNAFMPLLYKSERHDLVPTAYSCHRYNTNSFFLLSPNFHNHKACANLPTC
jgi:hypothetical protein